MIQDLDFDKLSGSNKVPGHFDVGITRARIATGVIVGKNDGRRGQNDGRLEHFPGMDQERIERAIANNLKPNGSPPCVQKHCD